VNYYRHHLGDYTKDTAGLSLLEHGAYRLLLDAVYSVEKPIVNLQSAYRICGASSRKERDAVRSVLLTYFVETSEGFTNKRAESEILIYKARSSKNSEAGRAGAAKKWDGERHSERHSERHQNEMANAMQNAIKSGWRNDGETNNPVTNTNTEASASCSEPPKSAASEPQEMIPAEPPLMVFPCVGRGPLEWPLTSAKLSEYLESYPGVDALLECRRALQWCRDNPTRRKTYAGMGKFLNGWLSKAQNNGGSGTGINGGGIRPSGGANPASREAAREIDQLGTIAGWAARKAAEVRHDELRKIDGAPLCDEADGGANRHPA